jgi:hypothetical protein
MSYKENYDPPGVEFVDSRTGRRLRLIADRAALAGWLMERNAEGKWALVRKATKAERKYLTEKGPGDEPGPSQVSADRFFAEG